MKNSFLIGLIDDILADGNLTEAHLRLLVERIYVYENEEGLSLDIHIKAPYHRCPWPDERLLCQGYRQQDPPRIPGKAEGGAGDHPTFRLLEGQKYQLHPPAPGSRRNGTADL